MVCGKCLLFFVVVVAGPVIVRQPDSVNVDRGGSASFSVVASGGVGLTYQWFGPDGERLVDGDEGIAGSTTPTLQVSGVDAGDAGDYTVVVTNSAGSVRSDAATLSTGETEPSLTVGAV